MAGGDGLEFCLSFFSLSMGYGCHTGVLVVVEVTVVMGGDVGFVFFFFFSSTIGCGCHGGFRWWSGGGGGYL